MANVRTTLQWCIVALVLVVLGVVLFFPNPITIGTKILW